MEKVMWDRLLRLTKQIKKEHIGMAILATPFAAMVVVMIMATGWMGVLAVSVVLAIMAWMGIGLHLLDS